MNKNAEYLPQPSEVSGSNGNGTSKVFSLKPATDPDTIAVLEARRECRADERLNRSMKACFDEIADRALNPSFYDLKGVVTISDTALAKVFQVSNRTVFTWKMALVSAGYVWLTSKFKSNMWPITTYHLSCLHRQRAQSKTDADGTYGGEKVRPGQTSKTLGARKPGQPLLPLPGSRALPPEGKSAENQPISGETRKKLPVSPETDFGSDPKPASGETRSQLRGRPETNFGSDPKPASGETRSEFRVRPEADCRHKKAKGQGEVGIERKGGADAPPQSSWEASFEIWKAGLTKEFDRELRETLADLKAERTKLKEFGGSTPETLEKLRRLKLKIESVNLLLTGPK
jgi:hypothetical protein